MVPLPTPPDLKGLGAGAGGVCEPRPGQPCRLLAARHSGLPASRPSWRGLGPEPTGEESDALNSGAGDESLGCSVSCDLSGAQRCPGIWAIRPRVPNLKVPHRRASGARAPRCSVGSSTHRGPEPGPALKGSRPTGQGAWGQRAQLLHGERRRGAQVVLQAGAGREDKRFQTVGGPAGWLTERDPGAWRRDSNPSSATSS